MKKIKKSVIWIVLVLVLFNIYLASAEDLANYNEFFSNGATCCMELENGAICQNVPLDYENCAGGLEATKCEEIAECKQGCCLDGEEGLCDTNAPMSRCEVNGGTWDRNKECLIESCVKGCCILGDKFDFVTQTRCDYLAGLEGIDNPVFEQKTSQLQCLGKKQTQDYGACVIDDKCSFGSEIECMEKNGNFKIDKLCTHPDIALCRKTNKKTCVEGRDEIYFVDSCGNTANIYDASKINDDNYWSTYYSKEESCNSDSGNINSNGCGNCNYLLGSKCSSSSLGNAKCKDMNCLASEASGGVPRKNGESWCVYDAFTGKGKDVVGSRNWRRMCINGEVKVEPCADYRGQVCVEKPKGNTSFEDITETTCRVNNWRACSLAKNAGDCEKIPDCRVENVNVDEGFKFSACVPEYPPGFDLSNAENADATAVCKAASQTCEVTYVKVAKQFWGGEWKCVFNCECEEYIFAEQMNNLCISLGDCGGYVNLNGDYTSNFKIKNSDTKKLNQGTINEYKDYITKQNPNTPQYEDLTGYDNAGTASMSKKFDNSEEVNEDELQEMVAESASQTVGFFPADPLTYFYNWMVGSASGFSEYNPIVMIDNWIWGIGDTKTVEVKFKCLPWQAPTALEASNPGTACDKCNEDSLKPCSLYRCQSLGKFCSLINTDTSNPTCISKNLGDKDSPVITPIGVSEGNKFEVINDNSIEVKTSEEKCIQEFMPISIMLETNEYAECKFAFNKTENFDSMEENFNEENAFIKNHTMSFAMPSLSSLLVYNITGDIKEKYGNFDLYVRCLDVNGNHNEKEYEIKTCINSGPDKTPAEITAMSPPNNWYLKYGQTETPLTIWMNEPVTCKYDVLDREYENMENEMVCGTGLIDFNRFGWPCATNLTELTLDDNKFYIKCKDQPWLIGTENESQRNMNRDSFEYSLYPSESELYIISVSPNGTIERGSEPTEISLEIATSGGAESGKSVCSYEFLNNRWRGEFLNTDSNIHTQRFTTLNAGEYEIEINCIDRAGNSAVSNTNFSIEIDKTPPGVVRAYNLGGQLNMITNEEGKCYYSFERCNFNILNATPMTTGLSKNHIAEWKVGKTYYIRCEDVFENKNPTCTIKLFPDFFG